MDADVPDEGLEGVASESLSATELLEVLPGVEMDAESKDVLCWQLRLA